MMYALPSYVWRVRKARAAMGKKERNRHRQSLMFIAAAVSLVVTLAYGDLGPYNLNDRHERGIFKGNHGMSSARTLLSDPITGEYAVGGSMGPGRKLLSGGGSCKEESLPFAGGLIAYFVGVFFMFLGIAIICDDFFVPALEIICEVLQLSDDVAGATFMAAGSSAPELAASTVSLISPDAGSEIGVGTIVGSAIFNILIIIGATVLATGNTLQLDWKPVTRDCFFYAAAIAGIVGTFAGGRVDWWEGLIYVLFYGCYIVSMVYNQRLMKWMDSWKTVESFGSFKKNFSFSKRPPGHFQHGGAAEMKEITTLSTIPDGDENLSEEQIELKVVKGKVKLEVTPPTSPTKSPLAPASSSTGSATGPAKAKAGWAKLRKTVVTEHKFADAVLAVKDKWKDKATLLNADAAKDVAPGSPRESAKITPTMTLGHIRAYRAEANKVAANLAAKSKAADLKAKVAAQRLEEGAGPAADDTKDGGGDDDDDDGSPFTPPDDMKDYPLWALSVPWYFVFKSTIPPCGSSDYWRKWYLVSFFMSIAWIGFITHWMVEWCVKIGCMLNIPAVVMGTTVLAAGTSIPDALSSIAVAKDGLADMAVANAVGSNVFDIWLGLGLPWLFYLSWQSPSYILVNTDELVPSSLILAGVLVLYYGAVATNGFKLTCRMGWIFIGTYGVYALYSIFLVWLMDVYDLQEGSTI